MCRHIAWLGSSRTVADLVLDQPHGLLKQSYAPRRQTHGLMNADGWGLGFYGPALGVPARWRSARPLWGDVSFASVAPQLRSTAMLAAVRSATTGMPLDDTAAAPFACGHWLFSHNGRVDKGVLPTSAAAAAESVCDAAVLAAHVAAQGFDRLGQTVVEVGAADPQARLTLLATDGKRLLGTTWGDTLSYLLTADGVAVASEPYDDDPRWTDVPPRHLIEVERNGAPVLTPLEQLT